MSFNRSGYIGRAPGDSAITIAKQYFQPTGVTTDFTFSSGYDPGLIDVYRNGIKLINVLDYAATDGSTISLSTPVGVGSTVQVVAYKAYNVATVKATELDTTVTGNTINLTGDITATNATISALTTTQNLSVSAAATVSSAFYVGSALTANAAGDVETIGIITAASFSGDGSGISGVVGVGTLNVRTESLTVSGVSTLTGVTNFSAAVNVDATTDSTSSTTGALIVDGGVGIAKNVYIGAGLSVAGTLTYEDVTSVDSVGMVTAKSGVNITGGQLTVGSGITMGIAGVATFSGTSDVHLTDGVALKIGTGSDLTADHNGTDTIIKNNTGTLKLRADVVNFEDKDSSIFYQKFIDGAGVELYGYGTKVFETTKAGTITTGISTVTGLDVADKITHTGDANTAIRFPSVDTFTVETGGTERLRVESGGGVVIGDGGTYSASGNLHVVGDSNSNGPELYLQVNNNNTTDNIGALLWGNNTDKTILKIQGDTHTSNTTGDLSFHTSSAGTMAERLRITSGGDVEFSGTAAGVSSATWDASANSLIFNDNSEARFGTGGDLRVWHDGTNSHIVNNAGYLNIQAKDGENSVFCQADGEVNLYHNNSIRFATTSTGVSLHGGADNCYAILKDTDGNYCWQLVGYDAASAGAGGRLVMADADGNTVMDMRDAGTNIFIKNSLRLDVDDLKIELGASQDLQLYHNGSHSYIDDNGTGNLYIRNGSKNSIWCETDGSVKLYYNDAGKLQTTNDGVVVTGIMTASAGANYDGLLSEKFENTSGKLSDNANIDLEDGMVHYFSSAESTTATPNIRYNSSKSLNNMLSIGDCITITLITTANSNGYSPNWTIDGSAVTEEWVGGDAPSEGGSDGYDIYTANILKTANADWKVFINLVNAT